MVWTRRRPPALFVVALMSMSILLRSLIAAVPPVLAVIKEDLGLSTTVAGLTTTVPVLCFGVFAFLAPVLAKRFGTNRTLFIALLTVTLGTVIKLWPTIPALFAGTVLMGIGVAIGNVLVLVSIRENYPHRIQAMMSGFTACINIGAAMGASLTIPVMSATGWSWNQTLGIWLVPLAFTILAWVVALASEDQPRTSRADNQVRYRDLLRQRTPVLITLYLATQSGVFYAMLTWLPEQMVAGGTDAATAGWLLGLFAIIGFIGASLGPWTVQSRWAPIAMTIVFIPYITGSFLILSGWALIGTIMIGFGQGASFSIGMTLIADLPDKRLVVPVSALAQGIAYFLAAVGPVGIGALESLTGNWWVPVWVEAGVLVFTLVVAIASLKSVAADRSAFNASENARTDQLVAGKVGIARPRHDRIKRTERN